MKTLPFIFLLFFTLTATAQPDIKKNIFVADKHCWAKDPYLFVQFMHTGGYLYALSGGTNLLNSNPSNFSQLDIALCKINSSTNDTVWCKIYGGSKADGNFNYIRSLPNGNILMAGITDSDDLDFAANPVPGSRAVFFWELDTAGNKHKERFLTGSTGLANGSVIHDVVVDSIGSIYAVGDTWFNNLDFAHIQNGKDGWIFKMDSSFTKEWMNFWAGYGYDQTFGVGLIQNGIVATGVTEDTGTVAMLSNLDKGEGDLFVQAYATDGSTLWSGRYGGAHTDGGLKVVYGLNSPYIYVLGSTKSPDGDIAYHTAGLYTMDSTRLEADNIWILQLDTMGNKINSKAYGSKKYLPFYADDTRLDAATWYKDNLWLTLRTNNGGGDFDSNFPRGNHILFCTFDTNSNMTSRLNLKDSADKRITNFLEKDGQLYAIGYAKYDNTESRTSFRCYPNVLTSSLLLGLDEAPLLIKDYYSTTRTELFNIAPNPSNNSFLLKILDPEIKKHSGCVTILNAQGANVLKLNIQESQQPIDCSRWTNGLYYIHITNGSQYQTKSFIKQ